MIKIRYEHNKFIVVTKSSYSKNGLHLAATWPNINRDREKDFHVYCEANRETIWLHLLSGPHNTVAREYICSCYTRAGKTQCS